MEQNTNLIYDVVVGILISALLIFGGGRFSESTIANLKEKAVDEKIVAEPSLRNFNGGVEMFLHEVQLLNKSKLM